MLSSGGVGYFEYEAAVDGNATLNLDVPIDQVDDILKSLVVYDDSGTAGEITLPGREPLTQSFVDLPFDRTALDSAPALLNALQGAELRATGPKPMSGRLLRVVEETSRGADGLAIPRDRVTLLTDAGIEQFILQDADSVAFVDPELQKKVGTALSRLASHRSDGRRQLTLESRGAGKRSNPDRLCRRCATVESFLSAEPSGRSTGRPRSPARLGDIGEFQRSRLARCEFDLVVGQPCDLSPSAVRKLLRQATECSGRSGGPRPADTRHRQHRGGRGARDAAAPSPALQRKSSAMAAF